MTTKICSKCKELKDVSEFHRSTTNRDGKSSRCKSCRSEDARRYLQRRQAAEGKAEQRGAALAAQGVDLDA